MHQPDFDDFRKLMGQLGAVYGKPPTDEGIQAYWVALKDQHFSSVKRFAEAHCRTGKFFPKPFELRPKPDAKVARDAVQDAAYGYAEKQCAKNLREATPAEIKLRKLDRLIATTDESHAAYPQILCEWRQARGIHVGRNEWPQQRNVAG